MPRQTYDREWAFDQFDVENVRGTLDITNQDFLDDQRLTADERNTIETNFIDQLYGTDNAQWVWADPNFTHTRTGVPTHEGSGTRAPHTAGTGSSHDIALGTYEGNEFGRYSGTHTGIWGLDLRRVLNEDLEVGTTEHYEWLTRGEVDWASYEQDNAYQTAFNALKDDADAWETYGDPSSIDFLTDTRFTQQQRVNFIRDANASMLPSEPGEDPNDPWHIPDDFDNKYTPKYHHEGENAGQPIDPEAVQPYEASNLFDPNDEAIQSRIVGADGNRMTIRDDISDPSDAGGPRDVAGTARRAGITIRPVSPERPSNLPESWGSITGHERQHGRPRSGSVTGRRPTPPAPTPTQ